MAWMSLSPVPGLVVALLFLLPFLDRGPSRHPLQRIPVLAGFALLGIGARRTEDEIRRLTREGNAHEEMRRMIGAFDTNGLIDGQRLPHGLHELLQRRSRVFRRRRRDDRVGAP